MRYQARTLGSVVAATIATAVALLVAPGGAVAATSCELTAAVLDVTMDASSDDARLGVEQGGVEILVLDSQGNEVNCTGTAPTVNNTDAISVHNAPGLNDDRVTVF